MDEKIEKKVGKDLYNDLSSIMSEEYEKRTLITPSYCANKMLEKGYRKERDTAREICDLILEHWEKKQFVECDWLRVAIAEKYGVDLGDIDE